MKTSALIEGGTPPIAPAPVLTGKVLQQAVAGYIEASVKGQMRGIDGIERMQPEQIDQLSVKDGTVFASVADALRKFGVTETLDTVGEIMLALGITGGPEGIRGYAGNIVSDVDARQLAAHELSCTCYGETVGAAMLAERVRGLVKYY